MEANHDVTFFTSALALCSYCLISIVYRNQVKELVGFE